MHASRTPTEEMIWHLISRKVAKISCNSQCVPYSGVDNAVESWTKNVFHKRDCRGMGEDEE